MTRTPAQLYSCASHPKAPKISLSTCIRLPRPPFYPLRFERTWSIGFQDQFRVSERHSCAALRFDRRTHRYKSIGDDQAPLRKRIEEIAEIRVRYGYRLKLHGSWVCCRLRST